MGVIFKIKQETYIPNKKTNLSFKRNAVPYREGFVNYDFTNKKCTMNKSSAKWKAYISTHDKSYLDQKKALMSGLVFKSRESAEKFLADNKAELDTLGKEHPTHQYFKVIKVVDKFQDKNKITFWEDSNK